MVLLTGCSWMRYHWEEAVQNLPPESRVIRMNNYYILFEKDGVTNKAYYSSIGEIYRIEKQ